MCGCVFVSCVITIQHIAASPLQPRRTHATNPHPTIPPTQILPPTLHILLSSWYGGGPYLERTVAPLLSPHHPGPGPAAVAPPMLDLELYPLVVRVAGVDARGLPAGGGREVLVR